MALKPIHKRVRKRKGWKLAYGEAQSGLDGHPSPASKTGKPEPTLRVLEMLADVYGVALDYSSKPE